MSHSLVKQYSACKHFFTQEGKYDSIAMEPRLKTLLRVVSNNVKLLLGQAAHTQRMAAGSGLSQKTISNLSRMDENAPKKGTTIATLDAFADHIGLPTYQLLIDNLPDDSARRRQLDDLVKSFVNASPEQQDWLLTTMKMMGSMKHNG